MNILYIPQLSMYDKQTGKYIPEADGNLNMMRNFIREWHIYRPNDVFFVLLPDEFEVDNWFALNYADDYNKVKPIWNCQYVISARINRYNFPMKEITNEINNRYYDVKFDLVINDIPELSRNIIAMFEVLFNYSPKIMSNIHHMDPAKEQTKYNYFLRILDAIECSDYVTILSDSMLNILDDYMKFNLGVQMRFSLIHKIFVFEPSISLKELENYKNIAIIKNVNKKIITFPGRLSKGEENRTNWDKFQEAIQLLREKRQDFEVYLTDPNNSGLMDFSPYWVKTIDKDRRQFLNLLNKTDIIVSLMNIQGFGGISIREALIMECMPIMPYVDEYRRMHKETYSGFIHGDITVDKIVEKLNWALDNCNYEYKMQAMNYGKQFSIEEQMPKLLNYMELN